MLGVFEWVAGGVLSVFGVRLVYELGWGFEWEMGGVLKGLMFDPCGMRILVVRARGF